MSGGRLTVSRTRGCGRARIVRSVTGGIARAFSSALSLLVKCNFKRYISHRRRVRFSDAVAAHVSSNVTFDEGKKREHGKPAFGIRMSCARSDLGPRSL